MGNLKKSIVYLLTTNNNWKMKHNYHLKYHKEPIKFIQVNLT